VIHQLTESTVDAKKAPVSVLVKLFRTPR
jgi:hypothetical protein